MLIPAFFYTLASFYHLDHSQTPMWKAIMIAIGFASIEYVFKVPIVSWGATIGLDRVEMQTIWIMAMYIFVGVLDYIQPVKG